MLFSRRDAKYAKKFRKPVVLSSPSASIGDLVVNRSQHD